MSSPFFSAVSAIEARITRAPDLLLCLDTEQLLPSADDTTTRVPEGLQRHFRALAAHPSLTLVILSGRNRADLQAQVGVPGLVYVGNLGLEISGDGFVFVEPTAAEYSRELSELGARLATKLEKIPGAVVEDKGLTVHIRASQIMEGEGEEFRRVVHETLAGANHPFHLTRRDNIYEVRPRVAWSKSSALAWIKEHFERPETLVIYVSDDEKDEEAVAALAASAITIKVGGPAETLAHYRLEGAADIGPFLTWFENVVV